MKLNKGEWLDESLGSICTLLYGKNLVDSNRNEGLIPVFGSAGIIGWHDKPLTNSATLIIGRKGSVGNVFLSSTPCYPIDTTYYVEEINCKESLSWLLLFLSYYDLKRLNMATAVPGLSRTIAHSIKIPLPPLEEQRQISSLFQSIDDSMKKVEMQEKKIQDLKNKLQEDLFNKKVLGNYVTDKDYTKLKFSDLALNLSERVEPKDTELTIYVGLEHLDPDSLEISRTGQPSDVIGTKLKIYKGDIIFGKRRAYQRKVAVSHFDGIASAHSMILRAKEDKICKDFLPLFMQSNEFMNRAVQISEGSLSPTIKWKTLADQIFWIPKLEKQMKIISLFKQLNDTTHKLKHQKQALKYLKEKLLDDIFK